MLRPDDDSVQHRCTYRAQPYNKGDDSVPPGVWPLISDDTSDDTPDDKPAIPQIDARKEDWEEVCIYLSSSR